MIERQGETERVIERDRERERQRERDRARERETQREIVSVNDKSSEISSCCLLLCGCVWACMADWDS